MALVKSCKDLCHLLLECIDALILVGIVHPELVNLLRPCVVAYGKLRRLNSCIGCTAARRQFAARFSQNRQFTPASRVQVRSTWGPKDRSKLV